MAFDLTAEQVTALPVDELALAVLHDIATISDFSNWNSHNWLLSARARYPSEDGAHALAEAWAWLYSKNLVALQPGKGVSDPFAFFVTRLGHRVAADGLPVLRAAERLDLDLHPTIARKVRRQFLLGEYELAAFAAMRQVEVRVREMAALPAEMIGVKLIRAAFGDGGSLRDPALVSGEQNARMDLFAGAVGAFKNPTSHREVEYEDPTEAAEVVLLADLLMRMLDRMEPRT